MMRFEWDDSSSNIGHYECNLYDDDKRISEISFTDYTCEWRRKYDEENRFTRPYSFEVPWNKGFDYDEEYDKHWDEDYLKETGWHRAKGGYQGKCTHTVDDIKRWCENWLAQRYLRSYYNTLAELKTLTFKPFCSSFQGIKFC